MKKKNVQDATLKNIRLLKKRVTALEKFIRGVVKASNNPKVHRIYQVVIDPDKKAKK